MVQLDDQTYSQLLESKAVAGKVPLLEAENQWLKEQLGLAKSHLYAPSSEASPPGQEAMLFNEAEAGADAALPEPEQETITYNRRKGRGPRRLDLEKLQVEEQHYDLPEAEQVCPQCQGQMHHMGEDVRQEVKIVPAQFILVRHICAKYSCRHCNKNEIKTPIKSAPMPIPAFPNSLASPATVAFIMSQKFVEGLPLYRQEQNLHRQGLTLSRQTMGNWMITGANWLNTISDRMQILLCQGDTAHADETVLQVLKEPGRAAQSESRMWLYHSGRAGPPIVLYEYQRTREGKHPRNFLEGFLGFLHVDGYVGYEAIPGITLVGCWAHVRRKFVEAINVLPPIAKTKGDTPAHVGLAYCNKLFKIERDLHDVTPEERLVGRMARSASIVEKFRTWLDEMEAKVLPKSLLGAAITYARNQWTKLIVFLTDGRLELDNNRAERAIRPFVVGRKNWLFANTPRGARSSAIIYSVVETAKENGLNPLTYLTYLFEQLPNINRKDMAAVDLLLPWADAVQAKFRVPSKPTQ
jgi:transposase